MGVDHHVILYAGPGYRWQRRELMDLIAQGLTELYVKAEDEPKIIVYHNLQKNFHTDFVGSPVNRMQMIQSVGMEFVRFLHDNEVTDACVNKGKELADVIVKTIQEDPSCITALSGLGDHDYYTFEHSLRVAAYAVSIAVGLGIQSDDTLRSIALGGVFHDVGKKHVPLAVINKTGPLNSAEWEQMKSHPMRGSQDVPPGTLPYTSKQIILSHHEKNDGSGYPFGKTRVELIPEVEIAVVADIFDALTSNRSYQIGRSKFEALQFIKDKFVPVKISNEVFMALVACLAQKKAA
jgi:HD-GYP domain-containing protein (c-di-GMP phosphodiesterase class II)